MGSRAPLASKTHHLFLRIIAGVSQSSKPMTVADIAWTLHTPVDVPMDLHAVEAPASAVLMAHPIVGRWGKSADPCHMDPLSYGSLATVLQSCYIVFV
jgi:hypothetical protein